MILKLQPSIFGHLADLLNLVSMAIVGERMGENEGLKRRQQNGSGSGRLVVHGPLMLLCCRIIPKEADSRIMRFVEYELNPLLFVLVSFLAAYGVLL